MIAQQSSFENGSADGHCRPRCGRDGPPKASLESPRRRLACRSTLALAPLFVESPAGRGLHTWQGLQAAGAHDALHGPGSTPQPPQHLTHQQPQHLPGAAGAHDTQHRSGGTPKPPRHWTHQQPQHLPGVLSESAPQHPCCVLLPAACART